MGEKAVADIKLRGGHPALDLTNTIDSRRDRWGPDALNSYDDLLVWAVRTKILDEREAAGLAELAEADASEASAALERVKTLREALYAVFVAEARDRPPDQDAVALLGAAARKALGLRILTREPSGFAWGWEEGGLEAVLHRVAHSSAELLVRRADRRPVRECLGPNCGWLFLDTSRGGRRRWCSDDTCGTHDRVRRFRARAS